MLRSLVAASLAMAMPVALAQKSYNPEIAYTAPSGKSVALYLANRDGTHAVKVYQGPAKVSISNPDLSPQGGAVAFTEAGKLRLLAFQVTPTGVTPGPVQTLANSAGSGPDFSPDGSMLVYQSANGANVRIYDLRGGSDTLLAIDAGQMPRWLCNGDIVVFSADISAHSYVAKRLTIDEQGGVSTEALFSTGLIDFEWDTARTRRAILYRGLLPSGGASGVHEYDLASASFVSGLPLGIDFSYSPDDTELLYSSNVKRSSGLFRYSLASGLSNKIGTATGPLDWAPQAGIGCPD